MSDVSLAFALWCGTNGVSRSQYTSLRQIHCQLNNIELDALTERLYTLIDQLKSSLPLLELRMKTVTLDQPLNLLVNQASPKTSTSSAWKSSFSLCYALNLATRCMLDWGHVVDSPSEFWHSRAWMSSIRASSGQLAHYSASQHPRANQPILPSDLVRYACSDQGWECTRQENLRHWSVIIETGYDHRTTREHSGDVGLICAKVQRLFTSLSLPFELSSRLDPMPHPRELFLLEVFHIVPEAAMSPAAEVIWHWQFGSRPELKPSPLPRDIGRQFIRRIILTVNVRPLSESSPIRGFLEIEHFGRQALIDKFTRPGRKTTSVPWLTFIDGFGLHRNMHRWRVSHQRSSS